MKTIIRNIRGKEWFLVAGALLFTAAQVKLELLFPEYLKDITALIQSATIESGKLLTLCWQMFAFVAGALICALLTVLCVAISSSHITARIRQSVFNKIMDFSLEEVAKFTTPSLITRCTFDVMQVQMFISTAPAMLIRSILTGVMATIGIWGKHIIWTSITGGTVALMLALLSLLILFLTPATMRVNKLTDRLNKISLEHLTGLRVIQAYNAQHYQQEKFDSVNNSLADTNIYINNRMALMYPIITLFTSLTTLLIYFSGVFILRSSEASHKLHTFSNMIASATYASQAIMAFLMLVFLMMMLPRMIASLRRISEVLNENIKIQDGGGVIVSGNDTGKVEFRNVSFRYPGAVNDALSGITFTVNPGQTAAIIGSTGSGKTSILNLIPRLYDVSGGEVFVDGFNVRDFKLNDLRERLGYVPQKAILFSMSIADNIGYGDNSRFKPTLENIKEAAEVGQASEFIEQQEAGYDTEVQQGGKNFSGGQKQRLTISRAISRNPEIYIFDDSFSALDFKTDKILRAKLRETAGNATIIIVAQRISTIRNADKIIVLDKGRIAGTGTHEELMSSCQIYREMAESQSISQ
ncbi:MAG: ABC transporter ATP-binding protein [Synergistaceae bacterium]|nr:ABC transporter ATP-binding protein [Synergistaceae bacterium]